MPRRGSPYGGAWPKLRDAHIKREPLCRMCATNGRYVAGEHVDHIKPIAEAPELRLEPDNLQTLCAHCHNSVKQSEERKAREDRARGYSTVIGPDGWPVDPLHPALGGASAAQHK